jgi:uncharacterized protein (DUF1697 family)
MATYVSLLRAINVGGHNKLPMGTLREVYASLGFTAIATYLQSGNVVFDGDPGGARSLPARIQSAIEQETGLHVPVLIRTLPGWRRVVAGNPFLSKRGMDTAILAVTFLERKPAAAAARKLDPSRGEPDEFVLCGTEVFLSLPGGSAQTKLSNDYFERCLGVTCTSRNWKTVNAVLELATSPR